MLGLGVRSLELRALRFSRKPFLLEQSLTKESYPQYDFKGVRLHSITPAARNPQAIVFRVALWRGGSMLQGLSGG